MMTWFLGAVGATSVWLMISAASVFIAGPLMHRGLLHNHAAPCLTREVISPVVAAVTLAGIERLLYPQGLTAPNALAVLGVISLPTPTAPGAIAKKVRARILSRITGKAPWRRNVRVLAKTYHTAREGMTFRDFPQYQYTGGGSMSNGNERPARVSIGMPAYNAERFVGRALASLLSQTFKDFELVISDDASSDLTGEICQEYAAKDARIRYIRQPSNLGQTQNFNFLLGQTHAEYFMWASDDDIWAPTCLDKYAAVLDTEPDADMVYCCHGGYNHATGQYTPKCAVIPSILEQKRNNLILRFINQVPTMIYGLFRRRFLDDVIREYKRFDFSDVFTF